MMFHRNMIVFIHYYPLLNPFSCHFYDFLELGKFLVCVCVWGGAQCLRIRGVRAQFCLCKHFLKRDFWCFLPYIPNNIYNLGLYTSVGVPTSKIGQKAAILIFRRFQRGQILRFSVFLTKMAVKSLKMIQFSQEMA